jgi:hypothetical protein
MSVELIKKDGPNMSYKYSLLSTIMTEKLKIVNSKYGNVYTMIPDYQKFVLNPSKKTAMNVVKQANLSYHLAQYSIVYRDGIPEQDFYFWLAFLHKLDFNWDDRVQQIVPFSVIMFDYIGYFYYKKQNIIVPIRKLNEDTYLEFYRLKFFDRVIVDLRKEQNAYILGYILRKCKSIAKKVRIIPSGDKDIPLLCEHLFKPLKGKELEEMIEVIDG